MMATHVDRVALRWYEDEARWVGACYNPLKDVITPTGFELPPDEVLAAASAFLTVVASPNPSHGFNFL